MRLAPESQTELGLAAPRSAGRGRVRNLLALLRPSQWVKNLLVVPLPLLYPAVWTGPRLAALACTVVAFTLAAAAVYVANDICDRAGDRRHPVKRERPVASGAITLPVAATLGLVLLLGVAGVTVLTDMVPAVPIGLYLLINAAYSAGLKHVPVIDVFVVAAGFELRIVAGFVATGLAVDRWLLLFVFLVCLVLVLGKRRREIDLPAHARRPVLRGYTAGLIDQLAMVSSALAAMAFVVFVHEEMGSHADVAILVLTPLVLLGLFRYLQAVAVSGAGADPVRTLLRDWMILSVATIAGAVILVLRLAELQPAPSLVAAIIAWVS